MRPTNESGVDDCRLFDFSKISDPRGNLTVIEPGQPIPFAIERVYWIYDVPGGEHRDGRACRTTHECFVSLSGALDVTLNDGTTQRVVTLNRSFCGLYVPPMIWRQMENFSTNAVCLVLASTPYSEDDHVRDIKTFQREKSAAL